MPLVPPLLTASIVAGLASSGLTGPSAIQLAQGVGLGVFTWAQFLVVNTVDVGVRGVGVGVTPFFIPPPVLMANLTGFYASNGQAGPTAPLEVVGLSNGLSIGLALGTLQTQHPQVGIGSGVAYVAGPPALPFLLAGFASSGIIGPLAPAKANAISMALLTSLATLLVPIIIVGTPSLSPSAGIGQGKVI